MERLLETERKNLKFYGYGIKGFTLSMIETALQITGEKLSPAVISEILAAGREMLTHPVETLPGVRKTLESLSERFRLIVITKGDLFDQERKIAESGLGELFNAVEIVSEKNVETYQRVFARYDTSPDAAIMAGNSVRSDVLPVLEAGGFAALVPYPLVWEHEAADAPEDHPRFRELSCLGDLPGWLDELRPH